MFLGWRPPRRRPKLGSQAQQRRTPWQRCTSNIPSPTSRYGPPPSTVSPTRAAVPVCAHSEFLRPVDDPRFVVIDLDFDSAAEGQSFRGFLTTQVWANPENSPGLAGTPETMILEAVSI